MHISKLSVVNYRNFSRAIFHFNKGTNTIIGENGSGKSNLFRAIRLLLDENMPRSASSLDETDFHRSLGRWQGHWIIISLEFEEVNLDEELQSLLLHGAGVIEGNDIPRASYNLIFRPRKEIRLKLANLPNGDSTALSTIASSISIIDYETIFTGRSSADFASDSFYREVVGDFERVIFPKETEFPEIGARAPSLFSISKNFSFTFIQALRDAPAEFRNSKTNPLLKLLKSKSGEISQAQLNPITEKVRDLNNSIEVLEDVKMIRTDIASTIKDAAGETYSPSTLSIKSDLPDDAEELFQSLRLFVGESDDGHEGSIHELSLGGANLIYLTLKLLQFKYQTAKQTAANFLLIEEPEAHIHTHIQKTLFDRISYTDTQIIYSTHSTHISEVCNVKNMNILGRMGGCWESFRPASGLTDDEIDTIQRYLDAVRSNLLFARSVILVEGDAEEILIPILIKKVLGVSLDELGISLINVRSTGFQNLAILFHNSRIRKRCAIITDLDAALIDPTIAPGDTDNARTLKTKCLNSQKNGANRKAALESFIAQNPWLTAKYAEHTFEVDFVSAGNVTEVVSTLNQVYKDPATILESKNDLESGQKARYGQRVLTMANHVGKGWFALLLGKKLHSNSRIPDYIRDAILFAHGSFSNQILHSIMNHRLGLALATSAAPGDAIAEFRASLAQFLEGDISLVEIRTRMLKTFPADRINEFLEGIN